MKRIGMLTSGGDCQALNAAMRGVVKCLSCSGEDVEIYGFLEGYKGLVYGDFRMLTPSSELHFTNLLYFGAATSKFSGTAARHAIEANAATAVSNNFIMICIKEVIDFRQI